MAIKHYERVAFEDSDSGAGPPCRWCCHASGVGGASWLWSSRLCDWGL